HHRAARQMPARAMPPLTYREELVMKYARPLSLVLSLPILALHLTNCGNSPLPQSDRDQTRQALGREGSGCGDSCGSEECHYCDNECFDQIDVECMLGGGGPPPGGGGGG